MVTNGNFTVRRRPKDSNESVINKFIKLTKKSGILQEIADREFFVKPSVKKRLKKIRRQKVMQRLQKEINGEIDTKGS